MQCVSYVGKANAAHRRRLTGEFSSDGKKNRATATRGNQRADRGRAHWRTVSPGLRHTRDGGDDRVQSGWPARASSARNVGWGTARCLGSLDERAPMARPLRHDDSDARSHVQPVMVAASSLLLGQDVRLWDAETGPAVTEPLRHEQRWCKCASSRWPARDREHRQHARIWEVPDFFRARSRVARGDLADAISARICRREAPHPGRRCTQYERTGR